MKEVGCVIGKFGAGEDLAGEGYAGDFGTASFVAFEAVPVGCSGGDFFLEFVGVDD